MQADVKAKGINRDVIKYIAMFTMLLNHVAHAFLPVDTALYEVFTNIGYFTAITMCYFLVEGFEYTHSRKKYAQRLLLFAIISEVPYCIALQFFQLNMLFTLLMCFGILILLDDKTLGDWKYAAIILIVLASSFSDWGLMAPIFTIMFAIWKKQKGKLVLAYVIAAMIFCFFNFTSYTSQGMEAGQAILHALYACIGIAVSGVVILCVYNGKRAIWGQKLSKWFFYIFYPAHLAVIAIIRISM